MSGETGSRGGGSGRSGRSDRARARLRMARRTLVGAAGLAGLGAAGLAARTLMAGASPLPPAGALYLATVAYGLSSMMKLRERRLFAPGGRRVPSPPIRWWAPRVLVVLAGATVPPVLLLGGLAAFP